MHPYTVACQLLIRDAHSVLGPCFVELIMGFEADGGCCFVFCLRLNRFGNAYLFWLRVL